MKTKKLPTSVNPVPKHYLRHQNVAERGETTEKMKMHQISPYPHVTAFPQTVCQTITRITARSRGEPRIPR